MAPEQDSNSILVAVRVRPFVARELKDAGSTQQPLECSDCSVQVVCQSLRHDGTTGHTEGKTFGYDRVFDPEVTQETVFETVGSKLLMNALNAYNGCIFAYGQTGSGKSHSVVGDVHSEADQGLLPRACARLFQMLASRCEADSGLKANVLASYLEIYNEKLFDLLSGDRDTRGELQVRLHPSLGAVVPNLSECPVQNCGDALALLDFGAKRRATGATQMNATSSRSHAVFTMQVRMVAPRRGGSVESYAKIHFVDLAGSERQKKTGAQGDRLKEGIGINKSLTTLGRVIADLATPSSRSLPPFRDSKLTLLLKDALMGNSRTALLACVSPARENLDETVSTLEFASRCKLIQTQARRNEQSKQDVIAKLTSEKEQLEAQLQQERADSEHLCSQLREELELAAEKHRAAEAVLEERRAIEAKLHELEVQNNDLQRAKEKQLEELREREMLVQQSCKLLQEKEQLKEEELQRKREELDALARQKREVEVLVEAEREERERQLQTRQAELEAERRSKELELQSRQEELDRLMREKQEAEAGFAAERAEKERELQTRWELREVQGVSKASQERSRSDNCRDGDHGTPGGTCEKGGDFSVGGAVSSSAVLEGDGPGEYMLVRKTWVTSTRSMRSERVVQLEEGSTVMVLEVVHLSEEQRIRGRLVEPSGWFSIENTADRFRWATRVEVAESDRRDGSASDAERQAGALQQRLAELESQELRRRGEDQREQELRDRLEREHKAQKARELELLSQIEALKGVQESFALDQAQIDAKREQQQRQREQELSALGMHAVGIDVDDMPIAPKLVNLHPDPALKGSLVYYLPVGETRIGADVNCRVILTGLDIGDEVCAISNEANEVVSVRSLGGGLVRVNGHVVSSTSSQRLCNGDRLAVGRAYIFQVQIPKATGSVEGSSGGQESDFERAMEEISAGAEVDPQWENGVQKAMQLVRSDFGPEAASRLLAQARRASEACKTATSVLRQMPASWTDGVAKFDLSIMFDAYGLPEVCVVARRHPSPVDAAAPNSGQPGMTGFRSSGPSAGIWEVETFWDERLPSMFEALTSSGMVGSDPEDGEEPGLPGLEDWQSRVWSELRVDDYKALVETLTLKQKALVAPLQEEVDPSPLPRSSRRSGDFSGGTLDPVAKVDAIPGGRSRTSVLGSVLKGMRRSSSAGALRRSFDATPPRTLTDDSAKARKTSKRQGGVEAMSLIKTPDAFHS